MNYSSLIKSIQDTFINQDNYFFDKHVPEFKQGDKFLGDYFNQIAVEPMGDKPPRFYHTFSPFDVISNKAPHYAAVFENGERILDIEFDQYVSMRSAAMNAVVLKALGVSDLSNKKVLLFGTGKLATQAVKILASELSLKSLDVITKSGDLSKITSAVAESGNSIAINQGSLDNLSSYDVIICHTQTTAPVIPENRITDIKQGAIITSFISSTEHGELPDSMYDNTKANIVTDWDKTILGAKDLQRAKTAGLCGDPMYIQELLSGKGIDPTKQYTIYRSTGTPIQNMAVLKLLLWQV